VTSSQRWTTRILTSGLIAALCTAGLVGLAAVPANAATALTPGNLVVYRVGDGSTALSGTAAPVFLDEYTPSGTLVQSIAMPTASGGGNNALVASGSASSEGLLSLSSDGRYLVAPGYDTAVGTTKISSSASTAIPRTIARVDGAGNVDTSTALTDFATGNNPRSATSSNGTDIWVGGAAGGPRYTTFGSTTSTELDSGTFKNVRQVSAVDGQLYASADPTKAGLTIGTVGTGLPTVAGQTVTNLPFNTVPGDPYAYSLLTLGNGTAPDTLYEADLTAGAVVKYGLINGTWTQEGSVAVPTPEGLTANDSNGTVSLYATSSGANGTAGTIYSLTDSSGVGGTFSGTASVIASTPTNEAVRGIAFAPGTVFGTGGGIKPPVITPTITTAHSGLPAALGDPTNPTLAVTVGDADHTISADQLTVSATSSNTSVAPLAGISVTGSGADRVLQVTPGTTGLSTITLTVTDPNNVTATTQVQYGVSADLSGSLGASASTLRYFSGAANASAAVDVGNGYAIVGDDESDVLHLYNLADSGAPVASFDFTSQLPFGSAEIDIEAAAREGNIIYWEGSMSTSSSGNLAPSRSTVFATQINGSGASTTLSYLGSYTGLLNDLITWDQNNGSGLGANYLGLAASAAAGTGGHEADALNVEGLEFAGPNSSTAYLAFRAPLEPTTNRHLAMLIPVTNFTSLTASGNPGATHATFGAPIFMDLGGLGIRDIKENANGQYLIIAGTADDTNSGFVLYSWDGNPAHAPLQTSTQLPQLPSSDNLGAWETIVSVPDQLVANAPVQLLQDDGDVDFYGDGLTSKTGEITDLQKNLGVVFSYQPPAALASGISLTSSANPVKAGSATTLTATVSGPSNEATPTGSVVFTVTGSDGSQANCATSNTAQLVSGVASCVLPSGALRASGSAYTVVAHYSGDQLFAASTTSLQQTVTGTSTTTAAASLTLLPTPGRAVTVLAGTVPSRLVSASLPGGTDTITVTGAGGKVLYTGHTAVAQLLGLATLTIPANTLASGSYAVTVSYSGDEFYSPSSTHFSLRVL
jgi:Bacterial Ig-like domain (group 3)/Protein of unknown function (DUF3616)